MTTTHTALDSSGNGKHAPFAGSAALTRWAQPGPYQSGFKNFGVSYPDFASPTLDPGVGTIEAWVMFFGDQMTGGSGSAEMFFFTQTAGSETNGFGVYFGGLNPGRGWTDPQDLAFPRGGFIFNALNSNAWPWNIWRHFAMRGTSGNHWDLFLDGVNVGVNFNADGGVSSGPRLGVSSHIRMAGIAMFNNVPLSDAQIAAHYAARTTNVDYKAAVLADSPSALWMLDEPNSGWSVGKISMGGANS